MTDVPSTDDVRDIWVDYHLNSLPRAEGIALVPEYQEAFDAWLETIRAEERRRVETDGTDITRWHQGLVLAYLRAQVEALRAENSGAVDTGNRLDRDFNLGKVYAYERILALIDRSSDE